MSSAVVSIANITQNVFFLLILGYQKKKGWLDYFNNPPPQVFLIRLREIWPHLS